MHINMISAAKWLIIVFGIFLISVGFLMFFAPDKARDLLRKAGSTNLINYSEITIRMIPAAGMIIYSEMSKYPAFFYILGWFMIFTSVVLFFIPRRLHHSYSIKCADILKPVYLQMISPFSILFGLFLIYCII